MLRDRIQALRPGLRISNSGNNQDFWGISFGRPTAFLLLLLVADWKWVTPNRITHASNALLIAGSLLILQDGRVAWAISALLINLSLSFDCADGQLARYRPGAGSELGSFYDKVSDAFGMILLFSVLGWAVATETGELHFFLFAVAGAFGQIASGYAKWVCMTILHRRGHVEAIVDSEVPLWQYPQRILLKLFRFAEPDLLFWVGLGLLFDRLDLTLWLIVLTQPPIAIVAVAFRAKQVRDSDLRAKSEAA